MDKAISEQVKNQTKIQDFKNKYIKNYNNTQAAFVKFMSVVNKSLNLIEDCGIPKMRSLYQSLKSNSTSQTVLVMIIDDYTTCFQKYRDILRKDLSQFDDTKEHTFNKSITYHLNHSDYDHINGNFLQGLNSSMELNRTLHGFIDYQKTKLKFYANYSSIMINVDTQIKAYSKKIDDNKTNLKHYETMRKAVTKLINGTQATIKNVVQSIDILNKDCDSQSSILKGKIARNKEDSKSFDKLIDYFRANYYKISEDFKKRYNPTATSKKAFIQTEESDAESEEEETEDDEGNDD